MRSADTWTSNTSLATDLLGDKIRSVPPVEDPTLSIRHLLGLKIKDQRKIGVTRLTSFNVPRVGFPIHIAQIITNTTSRQLGTSATDFPNSSAADRFFHCGIIATT